MRNDMKTHTIHWKSRVSGRQGAGTRLLDKDEAERLAEQLNREYPGIIHKAVVVMAAISPQPIAQPASIAA
jgi:hypothetical protein